MTLWNKGINPLRKWLPIEEVHEWFSGYHKIQKISVI